MEDHLLQRVLAEMAADDSDVARRAKSAAEWLTAGEGAGVVNLAGVQRFAWYELPLKWVGRGYLNRHASGLPGRAMPQPKRAHPRHLHSAEPKRREG